MKTACGPVSLVSVQQVAGETEVPFRAFWHYNSVHNTDGEERTETVISALVKCATLDFMLHSFFFKKRKKKRCSYCK